MDAPAAGPSGGGAPIGRTAMRKIIDSSCHLLAVLGCGLILLTAAVAVGNAVMRRVAGLSLYGANDLLALIIFVGIAACFPLAMRARIHMRVTILGEALGGWARIALEVAASLVTLSFLAALAWQSMRRAQQLGRYGEVSEIAGIPLAPWWWAAAVLIGAAALIQLWVAADDFGHYREGRGRD